jgi:PAS domain S-box-containing protein
LFNADIKLEDFIAAIADLSGITLQVHKDFIPIYATSDYARLYGFETPDDYLKLDSIMSLIPEDLHDEARQRYAEIIKTGRSDPTILRSKRLDGQEVWVKIQDRRLRYKDDFCVMTILIDISEEVRLKEKYEAIANAEQQARHQLENLQELRIEQEKHNALNSLLIGVSHQLNTPLGNILTSSSVIDELTLKTRDKLASNELSMSNLQSALDEIHEAVMLIERSVRRSSKLIRNVKFMVSREEDLERTEFRFAPLIKDTATLCIPTESPVTVNLELQIDEHLHTEANPNIWMQVMSILCENSLIHGFRKRGSGHIRIKLAEKDGAYVFCYSDDGHGIDQDSRSRIFEAFYSSKMASQAGLGLALLYSLVTKNLKGQVQLVEPEFSTGMSIELSFPAEMFYLTSDT